MNIQTVVILLIAIDIVILIISEILMKKYLRKKVMFPKTRLIRGTGITNDELDINNSVFMHMTDGIIAFDRNGEIVLINPAAQKMMNVLPEHKNFEDIFGKLHLNINLEKIIYLENWTKTEERFQIEDRFVNVYFAPFKKENDRTVGVIAVIQDITEHVKLDNMRKEFIADVSHELKTPITSIMGYADTLLEEEYDKETQSKFLNVIASEARRMAKLVTDLLTLSRNDSNRSVVKKEQFDLGELVKKCQDKLAIEIKKKNHEVKCFVTADVPPVYADKDDIERIVLNILTNSIKYTKDGGEIKIYVGFVYNDAYIKIFDNGIGIPQEEIEFLLMDTNRVHKKGSGVGLTNVNNRIQILFGKEYGLKIESELDEGTTVLIRIPAIVYTEENRRILEKGYLFSKDQIQKKDRE